MARQRSNADVPGWDSWGNHVLEELKRLNQNIEQIRQAFDHENQQIWIEISRLKVKAGIWGIAGGALAVVPTLVMLYLEKK